MRHRHSTDAVSLVFGLAFVAIAGWWLFGRSVARVNVPNLGLLVAGALILMGLLGVVASLRGDKTPADATVTHDEPDTPATDTIVTDDDHEPDTPATDATVTDDDHEPDTPATDATVTHHDHEPDTPPADEEPGVTSNRTDMTR